MLPRLVLVILGFLLLTSLLACGSDKALTDLLTEEAAAPTPTFTPYPTRVPPPTDTFGPTRTPTRAPTPTPVPPNLGISRSQIESVFKHADVGFDFEYSPLANGTPRSLGTGPDGVTIIEIIGPTTRPTSASIMFALPDDSTSGLSLTSIYLTAFTELVAPTWDDAPEWIGKNGVRAMRQGEVKAHLSDRIVTLSGIEDWRLMVLTIEAR